MVPNTRATVTCGEAESWLTPNRDKIATAIPITIAIQPAGVLKTRIKSWKVISPVAIGIRIATEMIVTPQLIPLL